MTLFNNNKIVGGFMDEIRCDEQAYLIWKWHPKGSQQGNNKRENAIRWESSLRVKDGEVAVFVYNQSNGVYQDFIVGPFDQTIKTANFPILANIVGLTFDGGTPFQAEVYFINLAQIIQIKFGVPFFDVYDPRFSDFGVPIAVRGTISFKISDYKEFIKLHRLNTFTLEDFQKQVRDAVGRYVKDCVANAPMANNIPVVQIESRTAQINDIVEFDIKQRFVENFGIEVTGVDISAMEIDKSDEGYAKLIAITADVTTAKIMADTHNYKESLRIQREEDQYAQHKQTQTAYIGAFQVEKQAEVGVAGAEALAHMGANGAGGIDLGGGGDVSGFNPAAMVAGMALGGAVGQNISATMNGIMSGITQPQTNMTPPPIPTTTYNVAVNGKATGPFDVSTLKQMTTLGQLTGDSLVWTAGMSNWIKANEVEDLKYIFTNEMPPIPQE